MILSCVVMLRAGAHLTRAERDSGQVQGLRVAAERGRVPVHGVPRAPAGLQRSGCVARRPRQAAGALQAPAARLPHVPQRGVPTPVVRSVTQEDDAGKKARKSQRQHAEQGEDALLAAAKSPDFYQDIIKGRHQKRFQVTDSRVRGAGTRIQMGQSPLEHNCGFLMKIDKKEKKTFHPRYATTSPQRRFL